jgi:hypothetical protein
MINEKYSYQDFTNISFKHLNASGFNDTVIVGSCFYQEILDNVHEWVDIFPDGVVNLQFKGCNLDNVLITNDMEMLNDCCHRQITSTEEGDIIWQ